MTNKVNNKQQQRKRKKAFHVKHNAHLICTHLYFGSRLDNEAQR